MMVNFLMTMLRLHFQILAFLLLLSLMDAPGLLCVPKMTIPAMAITVNTRIVILRSPAFRDLIGVNTTRQGSTSSVSSRSEASVQQQRELSETKIVREHNSLLQALRQKMYGTLQADKNVASGSLVKTHDYTEVLNGFSVVLTEDQEEALKEMPEVLFISEDRLVQKHATHAPSYLGLDKAKSGAWSSGRTGKNIVIGVIDTGIWPESASFSDLGYTAKPTTFSGACDSGTDATFKCNKKLVGARFFGESYAVGRGLSLKEAAKQCGDHYSPRDIDGHGTSVASIAASSAANVSFGGVSAGTIKGVAFGARLAAYKVFWCRGDGTWSDVVAAIDAAVKDGVDVLSLSLGGDSDYPGAYTDAFSYALYKAANAGVPPVLSAGNTGPGWYTLSNGAPWMMTVGASTLDRRFLGKVVLGSGLSYQGSSFFSRGTPQSVTKKLFPIISGADASINDYFSYYGTSFDCSPELLNPSLAKGRIVLCNYNGYSAAAMALEVLRAGGVAMVYFMGSGGVNEDRNLYVDRLALPAVQLGHSAWTGLQLYVASNSNPRGYILPTETLLGPSQVEAPDVAYFSSAGPSQGAPSILKPDVVAPGFDIIAAHSQSKRAIGGPKPWTVGSGTSQACPFVSGTIALLKQKYPNWTTSMYFSAITTTAFPFTTKRKQIKINKEIATPFRTGAGQLNPNGALDPGLVYALPPSDTYKQYLCSLESYVDIASDFDVGVLCDSADYTQARDLNMPSVVFQRIQQRSSVSTKRSLTNVGPAEVYKASVFPPPGSTLVVSPTTLSFTEGQTYEYNIVMNATTSSNFVKGAYLTENVDDGEFFYTYASHWWTFGSITWVGNKNHRVRIVVAVNIV